MESLRGQLLIASPALLDPNFARAVILVVGHDDDEGAMGLVLNRPTPAAVAEAAPPLADLVQGDAVVHIGGPVNPSAVTVLAEFDDRDDSSSLVVENVGFVGSDDDLALVAGASRRARVFAGYAGWAPGQLESELEREDWIVEPAVADDVFADDAGGQWSAVLRRKGGHFALVARMPPDPSVN